MLVIKFYQFLVLLIDGRVGRPVYGYILKEIDRFRIADFLRTVYKSSSMREDASHVGRHCTSLVGELYARRGLSRVVMIGCKAKLDFASGQICILCTIGFDEVGGRSTLPHLDNLIFIIPSVVHVEAAHSEVILVLSLSQHHNLALASGSTELFDGILPEVGRYTVGYVTAKAIDTHFNNPELHSINHRLAHILIIIVQVGYIFPIPWLRADDGVDLFVAGVPIRMFLHPGMIPRRVVGHPIENNAHTVLMAHLRQMLEIVDSAKLWGDGLVVADAIRRILAFLNAYRINGHHPHHVHA